MLKVVCSDNKTLRESRIYASVCHQPECSNINNTERAKSRFFGWTCVSGRVAFAAGITKFKGVLLHIDGFQISLRIFGRSENVKCSVFIEGENHTEAFNLYEQEVISISDKNRQKWNPILPFQSRPES